MAETPNSSSIGDNDEEKLCLVCNDVSSGKHYGAVTCEGCKGFFRRIICYNHQNTYQCINNDVPNECIITNDSSRRKCCKSCRFRKCLAIGMRPELCIKIERPESRNTYLDINGNNDPLFENEEQILQLRQEISSAYTQNFNPLADIFPNKDNMNSQYCLIINQLRLQLETKIRRFVSFVDIFRRLDVNVQSRLISDSLTELLVLMIVFSLERYQSLIRQNNYFFGDQELDKNFRSLITIMNELTNEILENKAQLMNRGETDPILSLIPALYLLAIVDCHRIESSDETFERLHVQKTKDRIMIAFNLLDETKAAKISQILHFLKVMNHLFEKLRVF